MSTKKILHNHWPIFRHLRGHHDCELKILLVWHQVAKVKLTNPSKKMRKVESTPPN